MENQYVKFEGLRIQKWFSQLGLASRRETEVWIKEGRIRLNGNTLKELGTRVEPGKDRVEVDGKVITIRPAPKVYWLFNKPDHFMCSHVHQDDRQRIYDVPALRKLSFKICSVGRLDFRTEGLLILSNDGEFVHRLSHPRYKLPRVYHVLSDERLDSQQLDTLLKGFDLPDGKVSQVKCRLLKGVKNGQKKGAWYELTVCEGRNRLVRRIFEHFGKKVQRLIRVRFGDIALPGDLAPGEFIALSSEQIRILRNDERESS